MFVFGWELEEELPTARKAAGVLGIYLNKCGHALVCPRVYTHTHTKHKNNTADSGFGTIEKLTVQLPLSKLVSDQHIGQQQTQAIYQLHSNRLLWTQTTTA